MSATAWPTGRLGRLVTSLAVLATCAACAVPTDDEAQPIDPSRFEATSVAKRTCTTPPVDGVGATVHVYLVNQQNEPPNVAPALRIIDDATTASPSVALEALFECIVTQDERGVGLVSAIPDETSLIALRPTGSGDGTWEVELGPLRRGGGQRVDNLDKLAVAQIFFTATAADPTGELRQLRFVIDKRRVAVNTDRRTVGQNDAVTREDFVVSSPQPSITFATTTTVAGSSVTQVPTTR